MATENRYFSGQGNVLVGPVNSSGAGFREVGNASAFTVALTTETLEHKESQSGSRLTDLRLVTAQSAQLTLTLESFVFKNLELALYGANDAKPAAIAVVQTLPTGFGPTNIGDLIYLDNMKVSSVVVKDSTGVPITLVLGTDYSIHSADHGTLQVLSNWAVGFVQPIKVTYNYAAQDATAMFKTAPPERTVVGNLLNTAAANAPFRIELYRVRFNPLANLAGISNEVAPMELTGAVLLDSTKASSGVLGQFGRIVQAT